jgi:hypothetical protein
MRALKYILIFLLPCFVACNNYEIQPEQAEGFIKFFSNGLGEAGVDVKPTADGGYVAVGNSTDASTGLSDIYLVKTDQYGNEESWSPVIIGGDLDDVATSLQVVSDGFVILGYSNDAAGNGDYDMYLIKTTLQGDIVWEKRIGGVADDRGTNLELLAGGGFIAAGITSSYVSSAGPRNAYWVTFDANGNSINQKYSGITDETVFETYIIEAANDYVICGSIGTLDPEISKIFITLIDKSNLSFKSSRLIGTLTNHYGICIQELQDGNLILCGRSVNNQGYSDLYLQELTPDLNLVWEKNISETGESSDLIPGSLRIAPDNSLAIVGTRTETENDDLFLLLTDADGNQTGFTLFGDDGYQRGSALETTAADNGWIIVGTNGFEDNSMLTLLKTDGLGGL